MAFVPKPRSRLTGAGLLAILAPLLLSTLTLMPTGHAQGQAAACAAPVARLVSLQGTISTRRAGAQLRPAGLNESYCPGDVLEVGPDSRAALQLPDQTVVSLSQGTTVSFAAPQDDKRTWLDVLKGALHIIARDPRALRVITPFANAGIEGTEFLVQVGGDSASVLVFEGRVKVENATGAATAASGERVVARAGAAPVLEQVVRPRDQVLWTLYYPPTGPGADPAVTRAEQQLAVGRVEEAEAELAGALRESPGSAEVLARQSVIASVRSDRATAATLADQAVAAAPALAAARLAQSYARQSAGNLDGAIATLEAADPANALVRARLAELYLASGDVTRSEAAANAAIAADPQLGLARGVLGFARLARIDLPGARAAFDEAIRLEPWAPLPRLGLGLAKIREGDLAAGRAEIETAVILDPNNALVRSYMGKAYYEEKRDDLAASQLAIAKELDPNDPTPWFYDAIRKQSVNRPVEALADLEMSVARNDNRAVFRSRLALDQDLAARSAGQGRIYRDLGFDELALRDGWAAIATAPAEFAGHRLLADSYASLPRHEIARVNELLQSQLLQPLSMTPVQPQLAEANLFILDSAGPSAVSFNEFNPLFSRDGLSFQASGVVGGNETWGDDLVVSGIHEQWAFSLGQFHFEPDGFRDNNDLDQDVFNGLVQYQASPETSVLAEVRVGERDQGDLQLLFDATNYSADLRQTEDPLSLKLGIRHALSSRSTILGLATYQGGEFGTTLGTFFSSDTDLDGWSMELQHIYQATWWNLITGVRYGRQAIEEAQSFEFEIPDPPFVVSGTEVSTRRPDELSAYSYAQIDVTGDLVVTLGASFDTFDDGSIEGDELNPKAGLIWQISPATVFRASAFRTLRFPEYSRQDIQPSLEPAAVAGFNQFFASTTGEEAWRMGAGLDHRFSDRLRTGIEVSRRDLEIPNLQAAPPPGHRVLSRHRRCRRGLGSCLRLLHADRPRCPERGVRVLEAGDSRGRVLCAERLSHRGDQPGSPVGPVHSPVGLQCRPDRDLGSPARTVSQPDGIRHTDHG